MALPVTDASYATPVVSPGLCLSTTSILCQILVFNSGFGGGGGGCNVCVQDAVKLCSDTEPSKQAMQGTHLCTVYNNTEYTHGQYH